MKIALAIFLAAFTVRMIGGGPEAPLEPSVLNEVEHALAVAPQCETNMPPVIGDIFHTNGLSASDIAISLVSRQDRSGRWIVNGTNATAEAVAILSALSKAGKGERWYNTEK